MTFILIFRETSHPNIVTFYGIYTEKNEQYIVTEYMCKGSLLRLVQQNKEKLTIADLLGV